jgi:hypothetical protein
MTVVPLVVALVIVGVADASSASAVGRATGLALALFVALLAVVAAATVVLAPRFYALWLVDPADRDALISAESGPVPDVPSLADQVANFLPANVIAAAADGVMVSLVQFALVFGFAVTRLPGMQRAQIVGRAGRDRHRPGLGEPAWPGDLRRLTRSRTACDGRAPRARGADARTRSDPGRFPHRGQRHRRPCGRHRRRATTLGRNRACDRAVGAHGFRNLIVRGARARERPRSSRRTRPA